jgi:hypothetical protein
MGFSHHHYLTMFKILTTDGIYIGLTHRDNMPHICSLVLLTIVADLLASCLASPYYLWPTKSTKHQLRLPLTPVGGEIHLD